MHLDQHPLFRAEFKSAIERVINNARLCHGELAGNCNVSPKMAREYFSAWEKLIELYRSSQNLDQSGRPLEMIPPDLMGMIERLCGNVACGITPGLIKDATLPGSHVPNPAERQDKEIAVTYIAAAKSGIISDKTPVKTVSIKFGVNRRTVQDWSKEFRVLNIEADRLPGLLETAGRGYLSAGRSQKAILKRGPGKKHAPNANVSADPHKIAFEPYVELSRDERIADINQAFQEKFEN